MVKKKIAFCTGTRAEYGLLKPLMDRVLADKHLDFELYVTGMHLSPEFGLTVNQIETDRLPITERVEILLSGDTPSAITKAMGLAMIGFGDVFSRRKPDIIVILGDRFEAFCVAAAATVNRVPIAHLHGGELTEGAIDDAFRHSITKMSSLHLTSTEEYRRRVIQLGESPSRVFNVGALGVENIKILPLLDRKTLELELNVNFGDRLALVTFHPATLEVYPPVDQMKELLKALDSIPSIYVLFTKANADTNGRSINAIIDDYVVARSDRAVAYTNMGQLRYLSAMKAASVVVGNSSSGIIEAPSFGVPTVNIGTRQKGRVKAKSVIDCIPTSCAIHSAIQKALSDDFISIAHNVKNPYEGKAVAENSLAVILEYLMCEQEPKEFYQSEEI